MFDSEQELLDVFDESGQFLRTAPRSQVHKEGLWHQTSQVWLVNEYGELLLQFRSSQKSCFPSLWDISSAGHIPAGDSPLESAQRELEEELGVFVSQDDFYYLFEHKEPYMGENHVDREIAHIYLVKVAKNTNFILQESEVSDIRWIHHKSLLEDFYENRASYVDHENHFKKLLGALSAHKFEDLVK
ncbi:MAG: NUDIX domain-containing protein [Lentisphaeraceae bacterium]|nr:NUDIX domain-containing protein [Lentisphaeraceae bacterium]